MNEKRGERNGHHPERDCCREKRANRCAETQSGTGSRCGSSGNARANLLASVFLAYGFALRFLLLIGESGGITPMLAFRATLGTAMVGAVLWIGAALLRRESRRARVVQIVLASWFAVVPARCVLEMGRGGDPAILIPMVILASALTVVLTALLAPRATPAAALRAS